MKPRLAALDAIADRVLSYRPPAKAAKAAQKKHRPKAKKRKAK